MTRIGQFTGKERDAETGDDYYLSGTTYAPHGDLAFATMGQTASGQYAFTDSREYNSRLQWKRVTAAKGSTLLGLTWVYSGSYQAGTLEETGADNAGNLRYERIEYPTRTIMRSYGYDGASRLTSLVEDSGKSQGFGYDAFGNVWQSSVNGVPQLAPNGPNWYLQQTAPFAGQVTNRLNGVRYTAAGHQEQFSLYGGPWTIRYDAEGRQQKIDRTDVTPPAVLGEYEYDAEGRRVKRIANGATTYYVYDARGLLMAEYGGAALTSGTRYVVTDHLGSTRLLLDETGTCKSRMDYAPFGAEIERVGEPCYTSSTDIAQKFTGKERDGETGLDYFGARYLSGAQGRFTSPDRPLLDQHPEDPQSWNLYSYVRNNPLKFLDPNGDELRVSQGWDQAQQDLCGILGTSDCAERISYDQKTQIVSVNLKGIDLSKNAGAQLLSDLTGSPSLYDLAYGSTVNTRGGLINVNFIENLDINPDWRYGKGKQPTDLPASGIADQIAFNWANVTPTSTNLLRPADRSTVVFHELAEAFAKIDLGLPYMVQGQARQGAHYNAMEREKALRRGRPELFMYNYGSARARTMHCIGG